MVNAKTWLKQKFTERERNEMKELEINSKDLEGELDLREFTKLEYLECSNNRLTNVIFFDNEKIKYLFIQNNKFEKNLSFLRECINLVRLDISNNPVSGSLMTLKNMGKLQMLDISDTDINRGIIYLPNDIIFFCKIREKPKADVKKISEELTQYQCVINGNEGLYNLEKFKKLRKEQHEEIESSYKFHNQQTQNKEPL